MRPAIVTISALAVAIGLLVHRFSFAADTEPKKDEAAEEFWHSHVSFGMPVGVEKTADPAVKAEAARLSKLLGRPPEALVWETDHNPVCAFWIESWKPNPSADGYVVIIQPGGGRIIATNLESLKRAIDHIDRVRVVEKGADVLPLGILTSYQVCPAK